VRTNGRTDNLTLRYRTMELSRPMEHYQLSQPYRGCAVCEAWFRSGAVMMWTRPGYEELNNRWLEHVQDTHKKTHTGNGAPQGAFAFTFTKSDKDSLSVGDMLIAVRKVMNQKSNPVAKYAWYYEEKGRDENGDPIHPHIHGMYETATGGRIEAKHWKRAWSVWDEKKPMGAGFRGGYHRPVKQGEAYSEYIKKDGGMGETAGLETSV